MIYLNCAATAADRPDEVVEAVVNALRHGANVGRGASRVELDAARQVMLARQKVARLVGFDHPERVVFCANATDALNRAIMGTVTDGSHVIATDWDHNSVLRPLYRLRDERGVSLDFIPADRRGRLDLGRLDGLLTDETSLVVLTHASNLTGDILADGDIRTVVRAAHRAGALVLLDASQTVGTRPVDMGDLGVDLLAFPGHKGLMGPQGTGCLVVAPGAWVRAVVRGGTGVLSFVEGQPEAYPEHLEAGTLNGPGIAGLAAAVDWVRQTDPRRIFSHDLELTRRFAAGARGLGATLYGDWSADLGEADPADVELDHAPVVLLNLPDWDSAALADALFNEFGIATRAGGHCAPRLHRAMRTDGIGAVRFSFGWYTTEGDVDQALAALAELRGVTEDAS